jgi:hypothetical protein
MRSAIRIKYEAIPDCADVLRGKLAISSLAPLERRNELRKSLLLFDRELKRLQSEVRFRTGQISN